MWCKFFLNFVILNHSNIPTLWVMNLYFKFFNRINLRYCWQATVTILRRCLLSTVSTTSAASTLRTRSTLSRGGEQEVCSRKILLFGCKQNVMTQQFLKEIEISWVGDFNPKMKATLEAMEANPGKKHITYRKIFEKRSSFRRATEIPENKKRILNLRFKK